MEAMTVDRAVTGVELPEYRIHRLGGPWSRRRTSGGSYGDNVRTECPPVGWGAELCRL